MTRQDDRPSVQDPQSPWRRLNAWALDSLFQVGYLSDSDLLLALSHQGRGVFNCLNAEWLARDYDDAIEHFDRIRLTAPGFGPLDGKVVRMAGQYGGGLVRTTRDGWSLEEQAPAWPNRSILLTAPDAQSVVCVADDGAGELRAYGFSETGHTFVVATSSELVIFSRQL